MATSTVLQRTEEKPATIQLVKFENLAERVNKMFESVANRAYQIFEGNGRNWGHEIDDWFKAEMELLHPVHVAITESGHELEVKADPMVARTYRAALRESVTKPEEKPFDSRPSDEERLAAIREEPAEGALACSLPASALFADYGETGRKMTWDYYVATFGQKLLTTALVRV
jgi:hypothetical protein